MQWEDVKDGYILIKMDTCISLPPQHILLLDLVPTKSTKAVVSPSFCLRLAMQKEWQIAGGKGHNKRPHLWTTTSLPCPPPLLPTGTLPTSLQYGKGKRLACKQMNSCSHSHSSLPVPELCKSRGEMQGCTLGKEGEAWGLTYSETPGVWLLLLSCCLPFKWVIHHYWNMWITTLQPW